MNSSRSSRREPSMSRVRTKTYGRINAANGSPSMKPLPFGHTHDYTQLRATAQQLASKGDTVQAAALQKQADSLHVAYAARTRNMAEAVGKGPLYDFLSRFFK